MSKFLAEEKPRQADFKTKSPYFSNAARSEGVYKGHSYSFCLPRDYAQENIYPEIRQSIQAYFTRNEIKWHDGQDGKPSNHMCDSQVCCANFLFPFADKPNSLATLLRSIYPSLDKMLPIEDDLFVAFEWIGHENYLNEVKSANRNRTRGANFTSADAAVMFQHIDGRKQIVLIEWKYTEAYYGTSLEVAKSGRKRTDIYRPLFEKDDCPIDKKLLPSYEALFYEPFYQFMRQQFLANEMEKVEELGAAVVSLMHIAPTHNTDFKYITSPELRSLGISATDVWTKLVKAPGKFISVSTEELFGRFDVIQHPETRSWHTYIAERYAWIIA